MGKISIHDIRPGMVLAEAVQDLHGTSLLPAGTELSDHNRDQLERQGIIVVDVEGVSQNELTAAVMSTLNPEKLHRAEEQLEDLFRHTDRKHPMIDELYRLAVINQVRREND